MFIKSLGLRLGCPEVHLGDEIAENSITGLVMIEQLIIFQKLYVEYG